MCVYRFHVRDTSGLVEDEEGVNLPDLPSVYREALRSVREFFADDAQVPEDMMFEVTDEAGHIVLRVPIVKLHRQHMDAKALAARARGQFTYDCDESYEKSRDQAYLERHSG